jgi:hypothetical protein
VPRPSRSHDAVTLIAATAGLPLDERDDDFLPL